RGISGPLVGAALSIGLRWHRRAAVARGALLGWLVAVVVLALVVLAALARRTVRDRSVRGRIAATMPPGFQHADARARSNDLAILTHHARADGDERADVVIEGIHFGDGPRLQTVDVRKRDGSRGIEHGASGLNRDDESRLLSEAGHHRQLVAVDDRDAHAAGVRAARRR